MYDLRDYSSLFNFVWLVQSAASSWRGSCWQLLVLTVCPASDTPLVLEGVIYTPARGASPQITLSKAPS